MNLVCPNCRSEIPEKLIDLSEESALCPHCREFFNCSDWVNKSLVVSENLSHPPDGTGFERFDDGFQVWVSTRSFYWIMFFPAACVCSYVFGFVTWGILLHGRVPDHWLQVAMLIILTPFYLLTAYLWIALLMSVGGKTKVEVHDDTGTIFKGLGNIGWELGWKRKFDWGKIKKVRIAKVYCKNRETRQVMSLEGNGVLNFASGVRADRLRFMFIALRLMHQTKPILEEE